MAPPARAYYAVQAIAGGKFWDFSGTYPKITGSKLQVWTGMPNERAADRHFEMIAVDNEWHAISPRHLPAHVLAAPAGQAGAVSANKRTNDQLWKFEYAGSPNTYIIRNRASNEVIQVDPLKPNTNGAEVLAAAANGGEAQRWVLIRVPNTAPALHEGIFNVRLKGTTKFLDLAGNDQESNEDGRNVQVWDMNNGTDRRVKFIPFSNGSGSFWIQFQNGGRMLDANNSKDRGANVQIWTRHDDADQQWVISKQGDGTTFTIQSEYGSKRVLDVSASQLREKGNGANVQMWDPTDGPTQAFEFIYAEGPNKGKLFQGE